MAKIPDRRMRVDRRSSGGRHVEELENALSEGRVEILFQPQFSCGDGGLVGAEALSRWHHPQLGRIGIDSLFDSAMRAGQAARLTRHIAERALSMAAEWPDDLRLSLNITAMDLAEDDFAETILAAVAGAGFDPARLKLEITEQSLVADVELGAERLAVMAAAGIRIALDDFGAGFCNFRYLKRLPLHDIKLDRSMIDGITEDERDLAVLRGIVALARALDLSVTAEGIETEAQRAIVAREGCAVWQGFFGAKPMTADDFSAFAGGSQARSRAG